MLKNKSGSVFIFVLVLVVGLGTFLFQTYQKHEANAADVLVVGVPSPIPTPTPVITSQVSPDGTHTVTLRVKGEVVEILVNDQVVTTRRVEPGVELVIPFNTWSPDNKHFFIQEKRASGDEYIVMTATGKAFPDNAPYLTIADSFAEAYPETTLTTVTGWAAPTLLTLNAMSVSESGMSFWFDIQTHRFTRLSTYFN
jgi:hypothetical protein